MKKYDLAARLTIQMVLEILEKRHGWNTNEALSRISKCPLYETLSDSTTKLWMDNSHDIADLFDKSLRGKEPDLRDFFK
jgi:hypothetical protein